MYSIYLGVTCKGGLEMAHAKSAHLFVSTAYVKHLEELRLSNNIM